MITTVCFDVHGTNAREIRDKAVSTLSQFIDAMPLDEWTFHVEVTEEASSVSGEVALWRGEVTAEHHGPPF